MSLQVQIKYKPFADWETVKSVTPQPVSPDIVYQKVDGSGYKNLFFEYRSQYVNSAIQEYSSTYNGRKLTVMSVTHDVYELTIFGTESVLKELCKTRYMGDLRIIYLVDNTEHVVDKSELKYHTINPVLIPGTANAKITIRYYVLSTIFNNTDTAQLANPYRIVLTNTFRNSYLFTDFFGGGTLTSSFEETFGEKYAEFFTIFEPLEDSTTELNSTEVNYINKQQTAIKSSVLDIKLFLNDADLRDFKGFYPAANCVYFEDFNAPLDYGVNIVATDDTIIADVGGSFEMSTINIGGRIKLESELFIITDIEEVSEDVYKLTLSDRPLEEEYGDYRVYTTYKQLESVNPSVKRQYDNLSEVDTVNVYAVDNKTNSVAT